MSDIPLTPVLVAAIIGFINAIVMIGLAALEVLPVTVALPAVFVVNLLVGFLCTWPYIK